MKHVFDVRGWTLWIPVGGGKISGRVDGVRKTSLRASGASTEFDSGARTSRTPPSPPLLCLLYEDTRTLIRKKKNLNHPLGDDINAGDAP